MNKEDMYGVSCDVCHRFIDPLSDEAAKLIKDQPLVMLLLLTAPIKAVSIAIYKITQIPIAKIMAIAKILAK